MYSPELIDLCIPYKIMSLVRKVLPAALAAVAPEAEIPLLAAEVAEAIEGGLAIKEGFEVIKKGVDVGKAVYSNGRRVVQAVNQRLGAGPDRKAVGVSQAAMRSNSVEPSLAPRPSVSGPGPVARYSAPVTIGTKVRNSGPKITHSPSGGMRVCHRELVTTIAGSVAWDEAHYFELNPGLDHCFPWLSSIAQNFQQYRPAGSIKIEFIPTKSTATSGAIYLSPCYVADSAAPNSEEEAANLQDTLSGSVWAPLTISLPVKNLMALGPRRFIRVDAESGDLKTFDLGFVQISTVGCADTTTVGRIFVSYDFEFFTPVSADRTGLPISNGLLALAGNDGSNQVLTHAVGANITFGSILNNGLRAQYTTYGTDRAYYFPRGRYLIALSYTAANTTGTGTMSLLSKVLLSGTTNTVDGLTVSSSDYAAVTSVTSSYVAYCGNFLLVISDPSASVMFTATLSFGGGSGTGVILNDNGNVPKCYITLL